MKAYISLSIEIEMELDRFHEMKKIVSFLHS